VFGSLGGAEIVFIFVLALLLFGPRKLPEIGRVVGRTLADLRRATHEFRSTLEREIDVEQLKEVGTELKSAAGSLRRTAEDAARVPHGPPAQVSGPTSEVSSERTEAPSRTEPEP